MAFTNQIIDGGDILLYVDGALLGCATSHSIELSNAVREVACKGSGDWTSAEYGRHSWTASVDALFNLYDGDGKARYKQLVTLMVTKQYVTIKSEYVEGSDTFSMEGQAIITGVSKNAGDAENASYSVSLQGRGALGIVGEDLFNLVVTADGAEFVVIEELNRIVQHNGSGTVNIAVPDNATYTVSVFGGGLYGQSTPTAVAGADVPVTVTLA